MSTDDQAAAYLEEAELTLDAAKAICNTADEAQQLWAQVVKNGYDAIEQAASAAIAAQDHAIPRQHPAKINTFLDLYDLNEDLEDRLLYWLRRRSESQYVDIRGDEINIPHEQFDHTDAQEILNDADHVLAVVKAAVNDT
jgi:HEPN domain-containing protein